MRLFITLRFFLAALAIGALGFSGTALAADDSYYIGARSGADVFATPNKRADVTAHLTRKTSVKILQKRRGWRKIETIGKNRVTGWVFEGAVRKRYKTVKNKKKSSFMSSFASFFRSPEPTYKTAVLGVRGLEDDGAASAERTATKRARKLVKWMDTLNIEEGAVAAFVDEGDLNP